MERAIAGDLAESEEVATQALQFGTDAGQPDAMSAFGMQLLTLRWMQGRLSEMVPLIEQTLVDIPGVVAMRSGLALGQTESGQLDDARRLLDEELANDFERGIGSGWLASHAMWALVACRTGHVEAGQVLLDLLEPWREQFISTHLTAYGPVAHPVALLARLLGRDDEADDHFAVAHDVNARMQTPYFTAFTNTAWAELLADRGAPDDLARARALADEAVTLAGVRGFAGLESAARALMERLG